MAITNVELWNKIRELVPTFKSHTAKGTADMFTSEGFESLAASDINALNEFFDISMRVALQKVQTATAKNIFTDSGIVEVYNTPNGGYTQRIAIANLKPETPLYTNLQNGKSVDPFIVRKPDVKERFFPHNFDYYSHITIQRYQMKEIFIQQYGMDELIAGIMQALQNGFTIQEQENVLECFNRAINSTKAPLQDTQKLYTDISDDMTAEELVKLVGTVQDCVDAMTLNSSTDAFNAAKFQTSIDADNLVLLMRPQYANAIQRKLITSAFNPSGLNMNLPIKKVPNFGGIEYYSDSALSEKLYPYYLPDGSVDGWSMTDAAAGTQTKYTGEVYTKDTNANIIGAIVQKGMIFENVQNPYAVNPIINPSGLYTNYHATRPNNSICYDSYYTFVTIAKANA